MNSLEKLIAKHCPNGVEYKPLGKVCVIKNGKDYKSFGDGNYPVYGSGGIMTYVDRYVYSKPTVLIPRKGSIENIFYVDVPFWNVDTIFYTEIDETLIEPKYLYYFMLTVDLRRLNNGGGVPSLTQTGLYTVLIAVPPLPVQREIVRMLDDMTGLISAIEEEIEARKKQYEWCRDKMLKLEGVKRKSLGELAIEFYRGNGILKTQVTPSGIPCVRYGEIYTSYGTSFCQCISHTKLEYISSPKYFEHGDILFAITGEKIDEIGMSIAYVGDERCLAGGDIAVMKHAQNAKFLSYALASADAQRQKSRGKVKSKVVHLSVPDLKAVTIPVPPDNVQNTIANKLDDMTNLIAALEEERVARKQQYEYYRDKLLTFKRKGGGHS